MSSDYTSANGDVIRSAKAFVSNEAVPSLSLQSRRCFVICSGNIGPELTSSYAVCEPEERRCNTAQTRLIILLASAVFLWLLAGAASAQDVQVNRPDNSVSNQDNFTVESETNHATFGSTVVVAYNTDVQAAQTGLLNWTTIFGFAYSLGAPAYVDAGQLQLQNQILLGDPAVAADRNGSFYIASLVAPNLQSNPNGVAVYRSTSIAPNVTFGPPTIVQGLNNASSAFEDKELIAVDTSGGAYDGRVYVAWTEFPNVFALPGQVLAAYSTGTNPLTFSATVALSPLDTRLYHGAMPAVGPNGEVYVVWEALTGTGVTTQLAIIWLNPPMAARTSEILIQTTRIQTRRSRL